MEYSCQTDQLHQHQDVRTMETKMEDAKSSSLKIAIQGYMLENYQRT